MNKRILINLIIIGSILLMGGCNNSSKDTIEKRVEVTQSSAPTPETTMTPKPNIDPVEPKPVVNPETKKTVEPVAPVTPEFKTPTPQITTKEAQVAEAAKINMITKIIVIDPGHANKSNVEKEALKPGSSEMKIKDGGGAEGIVTKTPEYLINMKVSMKLKDLLEKKGFKVVMTKTDNSVSLGNIERANIGNAAKADLVVRIHADSSDNGSVAGASMLVPAIVNEDTKIIRDESKRCGTIILNTLVSEVGMKNRGIAEHADMTGFNWSKVPVVLVEMGFLSNINEDKLLSSEDYESKLAKALFDGIQICEE